LGRVIHLERSGRERTRLIQAVALALRELVQQQKIDTHTRDLAAFIVLALEAIAATIDTSVVAWEKRGYWLKADRFRMEWRWAAELAGVMRQALLSNDWATVARSAAQVSEKLGQVKIPQRHRLGTPWVGAWEKLKAEKDAPLQQS